MARTKRKTYAQKHTLKELTELSPRRIGRLSDASLRSVVQKLGRNVATRSRKLSKAGLFSPGVERLGGQGIRTKGLGRQELIDEYLRAREFLNAPTTVGEARKIAETFRRGVETISGEEIDDDDVYDAMNVFDDLINESPGEVSRSIRYNIYGAVAEVAGKGLTPDEMKSKAEENLRREQEYNRDMSEFFKLRDED